MTRQSALDYVRSCTEDDDGPEARAIYHALYGQDAHADDDQLSIWSECCAHPDVDNEVSR